MEPQNPDLRTLTFFLDVYRWHSFSATARQHNLSVPVITRCISQLETVLRTPLFYRTTRAVLPTEAGHRFAEYAEAMLQHWREAQQALADLHETPSGTIRIHAPLVFGQRHIAPWLSGLLRRYPQLNVDLLQRDEQADFQADRLDLAFCIGSRLNSALKMRTFAREHHYLAAAPSYLAAHGKPQTPDELGAHHCLLYRGKNGLDRWFFRTDSARDWASPPLRGKIVADNVEMLLRAALDGAGLVLFPDWLLGEYIRRGELTPLSCGSRQVATDPHEHYVGAVYPRTRQPSRNLCAVLDYFSEVFGERAYWLLDGEDDGHGHSP